MNQYLEMAESMAYSCCCCCLVTKSCSSLCDPLPVTHQAPLSMGFPRQESWSGLPFPSPEDLPDPGIKPVSPTLQVVTCIASEFFPSWAFGEAPLKESDQIKSDQSLSRVWLFATPWIASYQASLSLTISLSLPKFTSIASVMPSNHFILCHLILLLPSIFPSIKLFSSELVLCIRWLIQLQHQSFQWIFRVDFL